MKNGLSRSLRDSQLSPQVCTPHPNVIPLYHVWIAIAICPAYTHTERVRHMVSSDIPASSWEYTLSKIRRKRMAGYIRESDERLIDGTTTMESAAKAVREHGAKQGYIYEPQYEYKEALSAASNAYYDRPRLMDMLKAAERREFDVLVVTEVRALSRRGAGEVIVIYDMLKKYGIELESLARKYGEDEMARFILLWEAEYARVERQTSLTRMMRGRRDRIEIGKALNGHKQAGYGHVFIDNAREQKATYALDTRVVYTDAEKNWTPVCVVRFMRDQILSGKSLRSLTITLTEMGIPTPEYGTSRKGKPVENVWGRSTVYRILTDPRIMGVVYANKYQRVDGKRIITTPEKQVRLPDAPPIITKEEFEQVQRQLQVNREESARNKTQPKEKWGLFIGGYCRCGICGRSMVMRYHPEGDKRHPYPCYHCRKKTGAEGINNFHVTSIPQYVIDAEGWQYTLEVIRTPGFVRKRVAAFREKLLKDRRELVDPVAIQAKLVDIQTQITNLVKLGRLATDDDTITQLAADINELEFQKRQIQSVLVGLEEEQEEQVQIEAELVSFEAWLEDKRTLLDDPKYQPAWEDKRKAIRSLGIRCTVFPLHGDYPFRRQFDLAPPDLMKLLSIASVPHDGRGGHAGQ